MYSDNNTHSGIGHGKCRASCMLVCLAGERLLAKIIGQFHFSFTRLVASVIHSIVHSVVLNLITLGDESALKTKLLSTSLRPYVRIPFNTISFDISCR
jgi:hypothetical protein